MNIKALLVALSSDPDTLPIDRGTGIRYGGNSELKKDEHGNPYLVLGCSGQNASPAKLSSLLRRVVDLDALDDDTPVYARTPDGFVFGITDLSIEQGVLFFSSYVPRKTSLPSSERAMLLLLNAVQGIVFCLLGIVPLLFGAGQTMMEAQEAMRLEALPGGIVANAVGYTLAGIVFLLALSGLQSALMSKSSKEKFNKKQRQSVTGELFQLPTRDSLVYFSITGIGEEVLFRVGILGGMMSVSCALGMDIVISFAIALVASSIIFAAAHAGSYSLPALSVVMFYGAALGAMWMLSGTILVPIIVHAVYDFLVCAIAHRKMLKDPSKFFLGKRPNAMLSSQKDNEEAENTYEIIENTR